MLYKHLSGKIEVDEKLCFVVMPYKKDMDPVYHEAILPAVEAAGMKCTRADKHLGSSQIMLEIYGKIRQAKLIIADISGSNPNVFYELGLCHALKPQAITIMNKKEEIPFDLAQVQIILYDNSPSGFRELRDKLRNAVTEIIGSPDLFGMDFEEEGRLLKKAISVWQASGAVVLTFEQFLQIALAVNSLDISEDQSAFLAYAAAYFGKFMNSITSEVNKKVSAIQTLVKEVATGTMTRVPWRAAAMLEHCDDDIVRAEIEGYSGKILNENLFPDAVLNKKTLEVLKATVADESMSREMTDKLAEVVRQIESEF
jgi:hypothetical protein